MKKSNVNIESAINTKEGKKSLAGIIAIVLVVIALFGGIKIYKNLNAPKSIQISTENGTATVYYKECKSFKSYVETLNNVLYNESCKVVDEYTPDIIFYHDATGKYYVKNVASINEYAEFLNYLLYNDDRVVDEQFLPKYVMYQKIGK